MNMQEVCTPCNLYEILVPCRVKRRGVPFSHHKEWDAKVQAIAGGLTVYKAGIGYWISPKGKTVRERMIPVRIACTEAQINAICDLTAQHYKQESVMVYLLSEKCFIKNYT
jgi:hypothetical protein